MEINAIIVVVIIFIIAMNIIMILLIIKVKPRSKKSFVTGELFSFALNRQVSVCALPVFVLLFVCVFVFLFVCVFVFVFVEYSIATCILT